MTRPRPNALRTDPITEFFRILRDPSPGSMEVAQDLLEENHLTLAQVSEAGEVFIPPNLGNEISISKLSNAEWLDHVSNSPARGYFNLTPEGLLDKHSHVGVAWAIQQRKRTLTFEGDPRTLETEDYLGALYIAWGRETWIETDKGITRYTGPGSFNRKNDPWFFESFVGFPKPDIFVGNLRPRLVKAAWRIARLLHRYAGAVDGDLSDVRAPDIMRAIRADFLEKGLVKDKSIPPDIVPMDDQGTGRRRAPLAPTRDNPPRVFRPQRVISRLEKKGDPVFKRGSTLQSPDDVLYALVPYMGNRAHEVFVILYVNVRNQLIGYSELTEGSTTAVSVDVSGILRDALSVGAAGMITVHQHPTGDPTPSVDDHRLWERIKAAGKLIGIPVVDNMVIGEREYYSEAADHNEKIPRGVAEEAAAEARERGE